MPVPDPWAASVAFLAAAPQRRWWVADVEMGARWCPSQTQNPRHRRGPYFTAPEAVEFVHRSIAELLRHRRRHGAGAPRWIDAREESWNRDPSRSVFVLVISGPHGYPPVYVKWLLPLPGSVGGGLIFISFHPSTRTPSHGR